MPLDMPWYIPVLIFLARLCDVPIGTVRIMLVVNGARWLPALLGFFEVSIWAFAVGGMVKYLPDVLAVACFAGGFAAGTLVGVTIEEHLALGYRVVRVISTDAARRVSERLRELGFRVTKVPGVGRDGPVEIAFLVLRRREVPDLMTAAEQIDPDAFLTVERADRPAGGRRSGDFRLGRRQFSRLWSVRK
jgi:uncharacterized protein YebE (UPF0316 family)